MNRAPHVPPCLAHFQTLRHPIAAVVRRSRVGLRALRRYRPRRFVAVGPPVSFHTLRLDQGAHTALPIYAYLMQRLAQDSHYAPYSEERFAPLSRPLTAHLNGDLHRQDGPPLQRLLELIDGWQEPRRPGPRSPSGET